MLAFHSDQRIKDMYIGRVKVHAAADEIIKGQYWNAGKGCAVGCTIHSNKHNRYEIELGIPEVLAQLEDCLFEGMPNDMAKKWPLEFLSAIPIAADLSDVWNQFAIWLLIDEQYGVIQYANNSQTIKAIKSVSDLFVLRCTDITLWKSAITAAAASSAAATGYAATGYATTVANATIPTTAAATAAYYIQSRKLLELLQNAPVVGVKHLNVIIEAATPIPTETQVKELVTC